MAEKCLLIQESRDPGIFTCDHSIYQHEHGICFLKLRRKMTVKAEYTFTTYPCSDLGDMIESLVGIGAEYNSLPRQLQIRHLISREAASEMVPALRGDGGALDQYPS